MNNLIMNTRVADTISAMDLELHSLRIFAHKTTMFGLQEFEKRSLQRFLDIT